MKSTDTQQIDAALDATAQVLADPRFYLSRTSDEAIQAVELVDHRVDDELVELRIRYAFTGDLNAAARAILDPDKLTWVQATTHHLSTGRVSFELLPDNYPDRMRCRGRYRLTAHDGACTIRTVATELHIRAPLVAAQVERVLMDGFRRELESQAVAVPAYVP